MKIIQKGEDVLSKKAKEIKLEDISSSKIQDLISGMKKTLAKTVDGVALAAPQVGESVRLFVVSDIVEQSKQTVYINPEIISTSKEKEWDEEGCLSVKGFYGDVERFSKCPIKAYNEKGELFTQGGSDLLARIFQHETDHLNGILFTEKAKNLHKILY